MKKKPALVKAHAEEEHSYFCSNCGEEDPYICDQCGEDLDDDFFCSGKLNLHFCSRKCYNKSKREWEKEWVKANAKQ